jgi:hypothetical protein
MPGFLRTGWRQCLAAGLGVALLLVIYRYPDLEVLKRFERKWTYPWLAVGLAAWAVAAAVTGPALGRWLARGLPGSRAGRLALAAVYSLTHARPEFRMLGDEHNHLSVAQAMYRWQTAERCDEGHYFGGQLTCAALSIELRSKTYPLLLHAIYGVLGESIRWAFAFNLVLYLLTGVLLARLAAELRAGLGGALAAAAAWYIWPLNVWWSRSAGYEMAFVFLLTLTLALAFFVREREEQGAPLGWPAWMMALTAGFACQVRPEGFLMMIAVGLPALPALWRQWRAGCVFLATWTPLVVPAMVLRGIYRDDPLQAPAGEPMFSFEYVRRFWRGNLEFFFNFGGQYPSVTVLALAGVIGWALLLFARSGRARWRLAPPDPREAWLAASVTLWIGFVAAVIFSCFNGDFKVIVSMRYAIGFYPPLALATGWLVAGLLERLPARRAAGAALAVVGAATAVAAAPVIEESRLLNQIHLLQESRALQKLVPRLDPRSIFIYSRPPEFLLVGRGSYFYRRLHGTSGLTWLADLQRASGGNVYYVRGLDCWRGLRVHWQEMHMPRECDLIERDYVLVEEDRSRVSDAFDVVVSKVVEARLAPR